MNLVLDIDGFPAELEIGNDATLQQVLQMQDRALAGPEPLCEAGTCGACTVLLDDAPVLSCLTLAGTCGGGHIVTAAGLHSAKLDPLRKLFARTDINPCGRCASGILVSAASLLAANPRPTREDVRHALGGHVCRCLGSSSIINAVVEAGEQPEETTSLQEVLPLRERIPDELLPSREQIIAALSHQQTVDHGNRKQNVNSLDALRLKVTDSATLATLDRAAVAFDWPTRRKPALSSPQRQLSAAETAMVEHAGTRSVAFVHLEFDSETAIVSLRKVVIAASAACLPPGRAEIAEAAVMDAFFIAMRSKAAGPYRTTLFPKDFPTILHAPEVETFIAATDGSGHFQPVQFRQAVCLTTLCAIGSAISRILGRRLPEPPFTAERLAAPTE